MTAHVDVRITDHIMHGMPGAELARRINGRGSPAIPVLIVSGFTDAKDIPAELPRLAKPFVMSDLVASLTGLAIPVR